MNPHKIRLDLGTEAYDVILGTGIIRQVGTYLRSVSKSKRVFILTDTKVGPLHAPALLKVLKEEGFGDVYVAAVPEGEQSKSVEQWLHVTGEVHRFIYGKEEKVLILNLGGGMVGDLGGFVAATYERGSDYVQLPTSVLAVADCALGGKVAVDYAGVKNLIGSFYQPKLVFIDLSFLRTLDIREIRSGLAEVVKYGVIKEPSLFTYIEENSSKLLALDTDAIFHVARESLEIKASIVAPDPLDRKGIRIVLNYGHTIGHAIEAASGYSYKHGEAISIGMVAANIIACELGLLEKQKANRIEQLLGKLGLPTVSRKFDISQVLHFLKQDKKFVGGTNRFVLPADIGAVKVVSGVDEKLIENTIRRLPNLLSHLP